MKPISRMLLTEGCTVMAVTVVDFLLVHFHAGGAIIAEFTLAVMAAQLYVGFVYLWYPHDSVCLPSLCKAVGVSVAFLCLMILGNGVLEWFGIALEAGRYFRILIEIVWILTLPNLLFQDIIYE